MRANIHLSKELYSVIGVFEIILRNSIDRFMIAQKGETWFEDAVQPGGYLEINPNCEHSFHNVHDVINKLGPLYHHDALIAGMTLGFWTYQFGPKEFAASGSILLNVFPNRPFGTRQKDILKCLYR
ncbi:MAG: hypothetical protein JNK79_16675 [Chitinophagaceae bacterium]|nr:hypothetical protein [Chitinophagaceae bacterium]